MATIVSDDPPGRFGSRHMQRDGSLIRGLHENSDASAEEKLEDLVKAGAISSRIHVEFIKAGVIKTGGNNVELRISNIVRRVKRRQLAAARHLRLSAGFRDEL